MAVTGPEFRRITQPRNGSRYQRAAHRTQCSGLDEFMMSLSAYREQWFGNIRGDLLSGLVVALALIP